MENIKPETNSKLDELMKEVPASFIDIHPDKKEDPEPEISVNTINQNRWGGEKRHTIDDYKYGEALALYGDNELSTGVFFKRLSEAIIKTISNEFQKNSMGSESLKNHFTILKSTLEIMAKEIEGKSLKDYHVSSIIASLHGFITNYTKEKEK